ncbi:MAG: hypothetical protein K0S39_3052 [Paenibacillus sp.]|jgi:hypothetical protein|nr:hypothetical protein [Paenibacillus sp.]
MNRVDLNGIIDLHVHSAPDLRPRSHDDFQLTEQAVKLGARAIVIKSHLVPTMDRAKLVGQKHPEVQVYGSITLNPSVGGINPHAVEAALQLGAKTVWLPTLYSSRHLQIEGKSGGVETVAGGKIVPPLKDVLKLIAVHKAILGTGHLSPEDIFIVTEAARSLGVEKIVVTHPESYVVGMTLEDQRQLLERYGVFFERTYAQPAGRGAFKLNLETNLRAIRELGYESTIVATDGGQIELPPWSRMITEYIQYLADHGVAMDAIQTMTKLTPAKLLDLP